MITTLGELLIDYTDAGTSEAGMKLFEQNAGGAVANVAVAVKRLGYHSAFIGKVGKDLQGEFLIKALADEGVNITGIVVDDKVYTTMAFVSLSDEGERSFSFCRKPGADTMLQPFEVDENLIKNSSILAIGSLSLTGEPSRSATKHAINFARGNGVTVAYDPNYRASLWPSEEAAKEQMSSLLPLVDVIKLSDEEINLICGTDDPEQAALVLLEHGIRVVCITLGKEGAFVATKDGNCLVKGIDLAAKDTTGAGDAFWGGFLYSLAKNGTLVDNITVEDAANFAYFGNAVATLCVQSRGAIPAMPNLEQVEALIAQYPSSIK